MENGIRFLKEMGWSGDVIIIDENAGTYYKHNPIGFDSDLLKYSWLLHDAVIDYAISNNAVEWIKI